jgi:hypothetical protein
VRCQGWLQAMRVISEHPRYLGDAEMTTMIARYTQGGGSIVGAAAATNALAEQSNW